MSRWCFESDISLKATIVSSICLVFIVTVLTLSVKQLIISPSKRIKKPIITIYFLSCFFSILYASQLIYLYITGCRHFGYCGINWILYSFVIECVDFMILSRIYFTFNDSILEITKCQKIYFFIAIPLWFIIRVIIAAIYWLSIAAFYLFTPSKMTILIEYIYFAMFVGGVIHHVFINIYGMILFSSKMYALVKMRARSVYHYSNIDKKEIVIFNEQQRKLLHVTAKYMTLLSIAIISTWIALSIAYLPRQHVFPSIPCERNMLFLPDCVINVLCLYLQFPFADKYYRRCCGCFGVCCVWLLIKKASPRLKNEMDLVSNKSKVTSSSVGASDVEINAVLNAAKEIHEAVLDEATEEVLMIPSSSNMDDSA